MLIPEELWRDIKHMSPRESSQSGNAAAHDLHYGFLEKANLVTAGEWLLGEMVHDASNAST